MKLSEKLLSIASWLEDENNELLVAAEDNDMVLQTVAENLTKAAQAIREDIEIVIANEPMTTLTPEKINEIAAVAEAFDESGDEFLQKQASVLDELLLTIAAPKDYIFNFNKANEWRLEELKKKYQDPKKEIDEINKVSETLKALEKSDMMKAPPKHLRPLTTRSCPDHPGAQLYRIGDQQMQCAMDGKIYDYENGFENIHGEKVPGGNVSHQTPANYYEGKLILDTRDQRYLNNG